MSMRMGTWFTRLLSPGGRRAGHQVLFFHRVLPEPDPMFPGELHRAGFDALLGFLKQHFHILPLPEAMDRLAAGSLPAASLSITFDDGYADNATEALPVLSKHGLRASFFIATAYLDGGRMWNDTVIETIRRHPDGELDLTDCGLGIHHVNDSNRYEVSGRVLTAIKHRPPMERQSVADAIGERAGGLPDDLMMSGLQVRQLAAAGMTLGAHTHSHPILACLDDDEALREIATGREILESLSGEKINLFAYPNGKPGKDYDNRHATMVREQGFRAAFSTAPGVSTRDSNPWQLPRFTPWDRDQGRYLLRLLMNRHGLVS